MGAEEITKEEDIIKEDTTKGEDTIKVEIEVAIIKATTNTIEDSKETGITFKIICFKMTQDIIHKILPAPANRPWALQTLISVTSKTIINDKLTTQELDIHKVAIKIEIKVFKAPDGRKSIKN